MLRSKSWLFSLLTFIAVLGLLAALLPKGPILVYVIIAGILAIVVAVAA